jgi:glutathione S-transferase
VAENKLYVIPGSHPSLAASLMLERKGVPFKRVDMIPGPIKQLQIRAMGFPGDTVPALKLDGEKLQGSREISRELDRRFPELPLFPADTQDRSAVEEAERWGDETLQPAARRLIWNAQGRDHSTLTTYSEEAKLPVPGFLASALAGPTVAMAKRRNHAGDETVRRDLAELPGMLDRVDQLIKDKVIGGNEPNAADFQIAPSLRLMMTLDDLRPAIESRPAGELAMRILPHFPGRTPAVYPADWLEPLRR